MRGLAEVPERSAAATVVSRSPPQGRGVDTRHLLLFLRVHAPSEARGDDQRSGHVLDGRKHPGCRWEAAGNEMMMMKETANNNINNNNYHHHNDDY